MKIAIDFDGTVVTHEYPKIGRSVGAEPVLRELIDKGHLLILFTMRHKEGLADAVKWFEDRSIKLWGVQVNPEQCEWTDSPKCYAHLYIDDAALGCPLVIDNLGERPHVDWVKVRELLHEKKII